MMKPVTLHDLAGWYHPGRSTRGVVMLSALGFEELTSRRAMRILADELALQGLPVLRFDYHGTADSAGDVLDPDRLERWSEDAHRAIDWLMDHAGVTEITLVGLRFGALLAARIASEREDITALGLLAPPLSGKAYLREQAMLAGVIGQSDPVADGINVAGFRLSADTMDDIRALGWAMPAAPLDVVLCEPSSAAAQNKILTALSYRANHVECLSFDGYEAMICDPTASIVPFETLNALSRLLAEGAGGVSDPVFSIAPPDLRGADFSEKGVTFGENQRLAGVLCEPHQARQDRPMLILSNAGGSPHIGWARGTVDLARKLATEGIATLRMDLGGLGDSRPVFERDVPHHYLEATRQDIVAAVDCVAALGYDNVALSGICSGAHHSFHAALMDKRVQTLILVNTLCFNWGSDYAMPLNAWTRARASTMALEIQRQDAALNVVQRLRARLLSGGLKAAKTSAKFVLAQASALRAPATLGDGSTNMVLKGFETLRQRGVQVHLVYSENDQGLKELEKYAGDELAQMATLSGVVKSIVPDADHTFTPKAARERLAAIHSHAMLTSPADHVQKIRDGNVVLTQH